MTEKMKMKFTVAIARDELKKMESESVPDYNKNAEGIYNVYKCQKLTGGWITSIKKAINEYEKNDYSIIGNNLFKNQ
jgi:hypothetical protein